MSEMQPSFSCFYCGTKQSVPACETCTQSERARIKKAHKWRAALNELQGTLKRKNKRYAKLERAVVDAIHELTKCDCVECGPGAAVAARLEAVLAEIANNKRDAKRQREIDASLSADRIDPARLAKVDAALTEIEERHAALVERSDAARRGGLS